MPEQPGTGTGPRGLAGLALGALGVVYGDIGTNILFALRAAFQGPHSVTAGEAEVLGVLSLVFWALVLVLSVKYFGFIMRADNRGEGGALALLALAVPRGAPQDRRHAILLAVGLMGAALVYGDGIITPAISVLAATEGLAITNPAFQRWIVPATVAILVALFLLQRRGTGRIGTIFGPVMTVWFLSIAALGIGGIVQAPEVLRAVSPHYALGFLADQGVRGFLMLGTIVLTVAGAEALYADMGHFGLRPIRVAWYAVVFPALLLNYFGQGAVLLTMPDAVASPFYALVPAALHYPAVILATAATIIASQALISGAFSLTLQSIQLGYLPRMTVRHTSALIPGRVYIPEVNVMLMIACIALVLAFRESSRLASAYGMAVSGAMVTTSLLFFVVAADRWRWGAIRAGALVTGFLVIDLSFVGANLVKIPYGAWIPLAAAGFVYMLMTTWARGVELMGATLEAVPIERFLADLEIRPPVRVPGTGVFLTREREGVPQSMIHYLERTGTLHERVVLMSIASTETPLVAPEERLEIRKYRDDISHITARYGFMQSPDMPEILKLVEAAGLEFDAAETTFFLGRIAPLITKRPGMAKWRKSIFALIWRGAESARVHLHIPPDQIVEVGMEVEI